jgi:ATP-dependent Clp protease ATP-binding subunit ClpX
LPTLKRILGEPRNSLLRQYQKLFQLEGIEVTFAEDAIEFIAAKALEFNLGARGLRSICEAIMTDAMFELPSTPDVRKLVIDADYALEKLSRSKLGQLKAA